MLAVLAEIACASLPEEQFAALAPLRTLPGIEMLQRDRRIWLRWESHQQEVLEALLPIAGVEFFTLRDGLWRRAGAALPAFEVPVDGHFQPLHQRLFPAATQGLTVDASRAMDEIQAVQLRLLAERIPRATSALQAPASSWLAWAESAPARRLAQLRAAARGTSVLALGASLPFLPDGVRLWGDQVLKPLGYRAEPELPERLLRVALGVADHDLLLVWQDRVETAPLAAFVPLERYGLRRLLERGE